MVWMPAQCLNLRCGYAWQTAGFNVSNGGASFSENKVACPRCGSLARVLEGVFTVRDGGIEMISGPQWSWDLVETLRLTLKRVVEDPPADPIAPVEAVNPKLGGMLRKATTGWTRNQILALLGVIFTALTWGEVTPSDIAGWLKGVERQITDLIDEAERNGPPSPGPGTSGPASPSED